METKRTAFIVSRSRTSAIHRCASNSPVPSCVTESGCAGTVDVEKRWSSFARPASSFEDMGMGAFADRTRRELRAAGETARKRSDETRVQLTAQEGQIARLAREGLTNPEIGTRLFISSRTVQYHLKKVFAKLDITSRAPAWPCP